jgi:DNA-binding Lrp family transcriptional regulator
MKEKDSEILEALRRGDSIANISKTVGFPKSTIYYHINKLKRAGFIKGLRVALTYDQAGSEGAAIMLVSLIKSNLKDVIAFEDKLQENSLVTDIYSVTGDWDFVLILQGNKDEITKFLRESILSMPNVNRTHSLFIIKHLEV